MFILFEKEDNEKVFLYFHNKYKKLLYKYAFGILNNHHDVEDVLQVTWINFSKNISKINNEDQNERKTVNYLITIVKNNAINYRNKSKVLRSLSENITEDLDYNKFDSVYMSVELDDFKNAIKGLDKSYIEPLLMKYVYGFSLREIAELLHISETNVGTKIYRAKIMIKQKLSEGNNDEK